MVSSNYVCPDGTPFHVEWPDPKMASYGWRWDQLHNLTPLTPLAQELSSYKREGMLRGGERTGRPFGGGQRIFVHGYGFSRSVPLSQKEASFFQMLAHRDTESRLGRLVDLWESSYRPECEALTRSRHAWAGPDDSMSYNQPFRGPSHFGSVSDPVWRGRV